MGERRTRVIRIAMRDKFSRRVLCSPVVSLSMRLSFILRRFVAYFMTFDSVVPKVTGKERAVLCLSFSVVMLPILQLLIVSHLE